MARARPGANPIEEVHPDRHRTEGDGQQHRDRSTRGRRHRLLRGGACRGYGRSLAGRAGRLGCRRQCQTRRKHRQDGATADEQQIADGLPRRARRMRTIVSERPDAILVNEGANTLDLARGVIDMYQPRKRLDVGTWASWASVWAMPSPPRSRPASRCSRSKATARLAFRAWKSRPSAATTCGLHRRLQQQRHLSRHRYQSDRRRGCGDDRVRQGLPLRQDDGGVRRRRRPFTTPDELKRAVNAAMDSGKPTLINAAIDPAAGSESGRIGNLNPQSVLKKK